MQTATIILENAPNSELDRTKVTAPSGDGEALSEAIKTAIGAWTLSVGDTIRIVD